jgi:aminocarboxymuconate-semialdehyde decarboxylase
MAEGMNRYGPTAARAHGRPGREVRPQSLTLDIHSHVAVPEAMELVAPHLDFSKVPLAHFATPDTKAINQAQDAERQPQFTDLKTRLADLDAMGLDMQLVMPPPPQLYYSLPEDIAARAALIVNDGIGEFCARAPDRFVGLGAVTLQAPERAVEELRQVMGPYGMKGVEVLTNVNGKELSDPSLEPFWKEAEALGALVVIHPNGFTDGQRLSRFYFNNVVGNPLETALALHYLIFDGVLERYPDLKLLAVHGGGYLGAYSGRIDHAWGAREDCRAGLPHPPTHYLKKVWLDSVVFTPQQLRALVETFGPERIVMGTDYPFDMGEYEPVAHVVEAGLDEAAVAAICGGNAKRLLGD